MRSSRCRITDERYPHADAESRTGAGRKAVTKTRLHQWTDEFVEGAWKTVLEVQGQIVGTGTAAKIAAARDIALDAYIEGSLISESR